MEKALRIILPIVIIGLAYLLFESIAKPIREQKKIEMIESQIIERLEDIKSAQFAYRDLNGKFASSFDSLIYSMRNQDWPVIKVTGDPEDSTSVMSYDTSYIKLVKYAFPSKEVKLDSLPYVPFNKDGAKFDLEASVIEVNGTNVPVFQVQDPDPYNPKRALTLGDITQPVYSGNWE